VLGFAGGVGTGALIVAPTAANLQRELAAGLVIGGVSVFLVTRYLSEEREGSAE